MKQLLENELLRSAQSGRPGVGLACPQIGIYKKMAIIRMGSELEINLVNATIKKGYDQFLHRDEGCLSFPDRTEDVLRFQEVYIVENLAGPENMILTGLPAICAQHELDHLNGVLLPDRAVKKPKVKAGPNQPCPCGKINPETNQPVKFKKCCGK